MLEPETLYDNATSVTAAKACEISDPLSSDYKVSYSMK